MKARKEPKGKPRSARRLRSVAEKQLTRSPGLPPEMQTATPEGIIHELQVHQIELEMQNDELKRAHLALEESRDRYLDLYDFAPVGYFSFTRGGRIVEANLTGAAILGVPRGKLINRGFGSFVVREDLGRWEGHLASVARAEEVQTCELELKREDDSTFYARLESRRLDPPAGQEEARASGRMPAVRTALSDTTERKQIEDAQLFLWQCGYLRQGEDFFGSLAQYLSESLGMDFVCIDRLLGDALTAQTVAVYSDGAFQDNVEYALKDTPCGDVVGKRICCFPKDVRRLFPQDVVLQEMAAESYVGTILMSFDGKPIGLIAVIGRKPLVNPHVAESVLKLVAVRATGELERRQGEEDRQNALTEARMRERQVSALLKASRAVLATSTFAEGARQIFDVCRETIGAVSGYVALLSKDGQENELVFLESGGLPCDVDPDLPMPIRGLRAEVYASGKVVYDNAFAHSQWTQFLPDNHVALQNVMFAPMNLKGKTVGLLGLANKPADFTEDDAVLAGALADTAAMALQRSRDEDALRQIDAELKRSNKDLEQFAHTVSHDLQEPLRQVSGFVELFEKRHAELFDETAKEYMDFIMEGAKRMSAMISDILAYSRVGTAAQTLAPVPLDGVVRRSLRSLQLQIASCQANITADDLPTVLGNATLLGQLFQNLIGNALKFRGDKPPEIHIGARQEPGHWLFWVRDNGIGFAPEFRDRVFEVFQRLHARREFPGTGIGLAICKRVIELHGGQIWAESTPGEGSTFYFTLPAK